MLQLSLAYHYHNLPMYALIAMEIRQAEADIMPVRGNAAFRSARVGVHADVVQGVGPTKPTASAISQN